LEKRPVCVFLIPIVRDSDRKPHPSIVWRLLQDALLKAFDGATGPDEVIYYRKPDPVKGAWSSGGKQAPIEDRSRKYTVSIPEARVDDLRALLRKAGNSFDQQVMYLEVAGYAEFVPVRPEDGFLDG
jgi:hypothetical protein